MARPYTCPYCRHVGESIRKGLRRTKQLGIRQIRLCRACKRKFTPRNQKLVEAPGRGTGNAGPQPGHAGQHTGRARSVRPPARA